VKRPGDFRKGIIMPHFVTSDNVQIYYEEKGEGLPIIFIHGWTQTHTMYSKPIGVLSSKYRCISFDLRGCGASTTPRTGLSMAKCARDVKELIEYLDLDRVSLFGMSLGASIIYAYARDYGCLYLDRVVIAEMPPKLISDSQWIYGMYRGKFTAEDALKNLAWMFDDFDGYTFWHTKQCLPEAYDIPNFPPELRSPYKLDLLPGPMVPTFAKGYCRDFRPYPDIALAYSTLYEDYHEDLAKITVPAAVMWGNPGSIYLPEAMQYVADHVSGPVVRLEYKPATHMIIGEHFQKVIRDVLAFMDAEY
jgi:pimeloyl-ACP methyl ester carboxylesterase